MFHKLSIFFPDKISQVRMVSSSLCKTSVIIQTVPTNNGIGLSASVLASGLTSGRVRNSLREREKESDALHIEGENAYITKLTNGPPFALFDSFP